MCYKACKEPVWLKPFFFFREINGLGPIQLYNSSVYFMKFLKLRIGFAVLLPIWILCQEGVFYPIYVVWNVSLFKNKVVANVIQIILKFWNRSYSWYHYPSNLFPFLCVIFQLLTVCMLILALLFSRVWLFATPWTVAHLAPMSYKCFVCTTL